MSNGSNLAKLAEQGDSHPSGRNPCDRFRSCASCIVLCTGLVRISGHDECGALSIFLKFTSPLTPADRCENPHMCRPIFCLGAPTRCQLLGGPADGGFERKRRQPDRKCMFNIIFVDCRRFRDRWISGHGLGSGHGFGICIMNLQSGWGALGTGLIPYYRPAILHEVLISNTESETLCGAEPMKHYLISTIP